MFRKGTIVIITNFFFPLFWFGYSQETIEKTQCMSTLNNQAGIDELKKELLQNAKRQAVNEIFGELITSFTRVENFILSEDKIKSSSAGFVRIKEDPYYFPGKNLGEICVTITAYAKDEDFDKFKPKTLMKKSCLAEGDVTTIKSRTEEKAKAEVLYDYDQRLLQYDKEQLKHLLHEIKFVDGEFVQGTSVYCTKVVGVVYPIEIIAFTDNLPTGIGSKVEKLKSEGKEVKISKKKEPENPSFNNGFLTAKVSSISKSEDGKKIFLSLILENITDEEIYIGVRYYNTFKMNLQDNNGTKWELLEVSGITGTVEVSGNVIYNNFRKIENYSVFYPKTPTLINIEFFSRSESKGVSFFFNAEMFQFTKDLVKRFSIGIPNIKID